MATTNITIPNRSASGPEGKHAPARMKFYVDTKRCIECGGCEIACKNENNVPPGIARIRVVTVNEGNRGKRTWLFRVCSAPMLLVYQYVRLMHCSTGPMGLYTSTRTLALDVAIASMLVHLVPRNSPKDPLMENEG